MTTTYRTEDTFEIQDREAWLAGTLLTFDTLEDADYFGAYAWEAEAGFCSICDAIGHGYPGGGPCPLEERGRCDCGGCQALDGSGCLCGGSV